MERTTYAIRGGGRSIVTDRTPTPVEDWLEEGKTLFGERVNDWKFKCPMCGKVYTVQEFVDAGGDGPNAAYQECIGRHKGAGAPGSPDGNPDGCNWAAYGLFGIPNDNGRLVMAMDGTVVECFDYAREEAAE